MFIEIISCLKKAMSTSYDAVIFDSDGVIVESPSKQTFQRAVEQTFGNFNLSRPRRADLRAFVTQNVQAIKDLSDRYQVDLHELCQEAASQALREQKREFKEGLRSLYDDVVSLRSLDLSLGVVSDNQHSLVKYALEYSGLRDWFDTVYGLEFTPNGLRRAKPNPYYLNKALSDLDTTDALYVGDRARDVEAANNAGIDSVLLCRSGNSIKCEVAPTYVVSSLCAIPGLLE